MPRHTPGRCLLRPHTRCMLAAIHTPCPCSSGWGRKTYLNIPKGGGSGSPSAQQWNLLSAAVTGKAPQCLIPGSSTKRGQGGREIAAW